MTERRPTPDEARLSRYEKPKLLVFGDVRELTLAVGDTGKDDGGIVANMKKTSL